MKIETIDPTTEASWLIEGLQPDLSEESLRDLIIRTTSKEPAVYLAAIERNRVVGFAAFRSHRLIDGHSRSLLAFQAAGVLTSRDHRGRGIFPTIVREAEMIFKSRSCSLIFGFPNGNAYPVWITKLGYSEVALRKWQAPLILGGANLLISNGRLDTSSAVLQDDVDLIASKRSLYGSDLVTVNIDEASAWGIRRRRRRLGIDVSVLHIGGICCRSGRDLKALMAALSGDTNTLKMAQLVATASNPILRTLRMTRPVPAAHEVVIYKWLNPRDESNARLAFCSGMADWF